jgi:uncharacterized protein (TIGR03084 family)
MEIFGDLVTEYDRIESILDGLDADAWLSPSGAPEWSVADVVLHLAQTEEAVVRSIDEPVDRSWWREGPETVDELVDIRVREERTAADEIFARWKVARRASVAAMRAAQAADPHQRFRWAAAPLRPATLATTRLAEHWAHALDITGPLGIDYPDTDRLRHIAWLGHATLPYAFGLAGLEPAPVRCELTGPGGEVWQYGPADAESSITGAAGAFCRVGAQRLAPEDSGLVTSGPHGSAALGVLRNYAY